MQIKRVKTYSIPVYPKQVYTVPPSSRLMASVGSGVLATATVLCLEACLTPTTSGVPPVRMATEVEARAVIKRVFTENGIVLKDDVAMDVSTAQGVTRSVVLDGYNDSLRVGYEYLVDKTDTEFDSSVCDALDSVFAENGPFVEVIDQANYDNREELLTNTVQEFLDTLKARGII